MHVTCTMVRSFDAMTMCKCVSFVARISVHQAIISPRAQNQKDTSTYNGNHYFVLYSTFICSASNLPMVYDVMYFGRCCVVK